MPKSANTVEIEKALAGYIQIVCEAADVTRNADDRTAYERHLSAAARMFAALRRDPSLQDLRSLVASEQRSYGLSFLSNDEGQRTEAAFAQFAGLIDQS